jgi:hypothetical protein
MSSRFRLRQIRSRVAYGLNQGVAGVMGNQARTAGIARRRRAAISLDGRFVVFEWASSNLVTDDTNDSDDVYLRGPLPRLHPPRMTAATPLDD